jgi:beta-N-acetylglucosaminidase
VSRQRKKGWFPLIIGDDWFTKNMLVNTLSKNEKLKSQNTPATGNINNLFATVLNQLMVQQDLQSSTASKVTSFVPPMFSEADYTMSDTNFTPRTNESLRYRSLSAESLDQVLGGKLTGMGEVFIQAGKKYNIDPALLTAIAQHETGNGKSKAAIEKNNIAGMMGKNGLRSYGSVEESIMDMARNLSKNYLGQGLDTISKIGAKYAPIGAGNDPTGLNNYWVRGVTKYTNLLKV